MTTSVVGFSKGNILGEQKNEWRLLDLEYPDPYMNLAVEEAILLAVNEGKAPSTLRFWRNANAVVLGYNNKVDHEVNMKACKENNTAIARRPSGGGAVYQDYGNLNWSITMRRNSIPVPQDPLEVYKRIGKVIAKSVKVHGADAVFKAPNMIQLNGKKISGIAMYCKKNAILCHGTLLVNSDLEILLNALKVLRAEVTTLEQELGIFLPLDKVKRSIIASMQEMQNIQLKKVRFVEGDMARRLYCQKYSKMEWNYGVVP